MNNINLIDELTNYYKEDLDVDNRGMIFDCSDGDDLCKDTYEDTINFIKKQVAKEKEWEYRRGQENIRSAFKMLIGIDMSQLSK